MRFDDLQTLIIEQETVVLSTEAAQAMEKLIKRQTKQVFMKGLGAIKGFQLRRRTLHSYKALYKLLVRKKNSKHHPKKPKGCTLEQNVNLNQI